MWKNYFKVSFRNLSKRKLYTGINILGLTIAIVSFLAISLYIYHELSYDKMYTDSERIYKFNQEFVSGGETQLVGTTPSLLVPTLMEEVPEVEIATLLFDLSIFSSVMVEAGEGNQEESKFAFADQNFFKVFDFEMIFGNPDLVLTEPNQIVLTESTAKRYFRNTADANGKTLKIDGKEYLVKGVMQDFPSNSHLDFDFIASFATHRHGKNPEWSPSNYYSYAKLIPEADLPALTSKLDQMVEKYMGEDMNNYGFKTSFLFQPVTSIHLGDNRLQTVKPTSDIRQLYIFGLVAVLLIFIGIINYVNLATAEATERNKEVGLRKVMGASRVQLFGQFISESFILTFSGLIFSLLVLYFLEQPFENFSGVPLQLDLLVSPVGMVAVFGLLLVIGFLSGIYPALFLSGMEPLRALGKNIKILGGAWLRKGLVVFQFFVSIGLLVATLIVQQQLDYMREVNLGYDREEVVALSYHYNMRETVGSLKNELLRSGAAQSVTLAADMPIYIKAGYKIFPGFGNEKEIMITGYSVDPDIVKTLGFKILAGEDFAADELTRTAARDQDIEHAVMLNEAAVKELGWTNEEAVGKKLNFGSPTYVKAVVADFYFNSLHHQVGPLAIMVDPEQSNVILAKLPKGNPTENLATMEGIWKTLAPDRPFNYKFVDQEYARMYSSEEKTGTIFSLFSGIAILIACMGLFGLVSYVALRKTREISIRKVLGAKASDVLKVLSADFFVLLGVSAVLATVFGIWFSNQWLEGFANKTEVSPWIFVTAILVVGFISFLTIGYRTIKVFVQNPANTLKDE
ncbi:putative ABC transport system permease protein [Aquiflexum balticum DSM 16537]|uniref:Putative ABC transport system permease protein n=1 Tax=Aquiflexum balticum DSM 16537 TaxID=758820 RepID=A0A1W2H9T8_9BACT|nr:FtsX-like permease family protein [Aquiflexum balticum]SMD45326.1 putative ABC transport system permease protein [Aquiflexum balticum DSM 16537]